MTDEQLVQIVFPTSAKKNFRDLLYDAHKVFLELAAGRRDRHHRWQADASSVSSRAMTLDGTKSDVRWDGCAPF